MADNEKLTQWITNFEQDLKLYLQALYLKKQPSLPGGFCQELFAANANLPTLLKTYPDALDTLLDKEKQLGKIALILLEAMQGNLEVDIHAADARQNPYWALIETINNFYYENPKSSLLLLLQHNMFLLGDTFPKFTFIIETPFYKTGPKNIDEQAHDAFQREQAERNKIIAAATPTYPNLDVWKTATENNLKLYLQWKYFQKTQGILTLFAPAVAKDFTAKLFSDASLKDIMAMENDFKILFGNSKNSFKAFTAAYYQIADASLENAIYVVDALSVIVKDLKNHGNSQAFLPILLDAQNKLSMLALPATVVTNFDNVRKVHDLHLTVKNQQNANNQPPRSHLPTFP